MKVYCLIQPTKHQDITFSHRLTDKNYSANCFIVNMWSPLDHHRQMEPVTTVNLEALCITGLLPIHRISTPCFKTNESLFNNSVKNEPILIILGTTNPEEIWHMRFWICSPNVKKCSQCTWRNFKKINVAHNLSNSSVKRFYTTAHIWLWRGGKVTKI